MSGFTIMCKKGKVLSLKDSARVLCTMSERLKTKDKYYDKS